MSVKVLLRVKCEMGPSGAMMMKDAEGLEGRCPIARSLVCGKCICSEGTASQTLFLQDNHA